MEKKEDVVQQIPAKRAPAIALVGASGAGKTTQVMSLAAAAKNANLKMVVACFDSGSIQAYECGSGYTILQEDELAPITELCEQYSSKQYLLVVDTWRAYEKWSVLQYKKGKKSQISLRDWQSITSAWMDDIVSIYGRKNAVMVVQISSGPTLVDSVDADGKPTKEKIPPGQIVCAPSLKKEGAELAQSAPVVLPLSSGGQTGERAWATQLGQVGRKYVRVAPDGKVTYALPGSGDDDKITSVKVCSLADIWTSLLR